MASTNPGFRRGFTLMELLTVMIIMSIVLATGIVSYVSARRGMEKRAAVGSVQSTLSLARQHAVTKRRMTAVVFRLEGDEVSGTNCYYIFERVGKASQPSSGGSTLYAIPPPLTSDKGYWPSNGTLICNMTATDGLIGRLDNAGLHEAIDPAGLIIRGSTLVTWLPGETAGGWAVGNAYGFQVGEKLFIPPGIKCKIGASEAKNGIVLFYPNGKASGMAPIDIKFTDKMKTDGTLFKTITVYPLLGLVKVDGWE